MTRCAAPLQVNPPQPSSAIERPVGQKYFGVYAVGWVFGSALTTFHCARTIFC